LNIYEESLEMHRQKVGKIDITTRVEVKNEHDLSLAYTPGVAEPCRQIAKNPLLLDVYTSRGNMIAVVTDGSAVLGLGNIGARAGLPVMEGKCVLFKVFGGVNAFPICLDTQEPDEIVHTVKLLEPSFAGINLEDISAPNCFEIERRLKKETNMVIFHDDQHGTAIVVLAGLINACKLAGKKLENQKVIINGLGAAGNSITLMLLKVGIRDIITVDSRGAVYKGRKEGMNWSKDEIALVTNSDGLRGELGDVIVGRDVFIGVSSAGALTSAMIRKMAKDPIIFAMANPEPEVLPDVATEAGAFIVATGRSDYPNQVNNVLAFPGVFRGALDITATAINDEMKIAAAHAIASLVKDDELLKSYIIPKPFDPRVGPAVASAVARAAIETEVARAEISPEEIAKRAKEMSSAW
jgi:malate dehydrogenase (oxaloacetate-decarboxylating)